MSPHRDDANAVDTNSIDLTDHELKLLAAFRSAPEPVKAMAFSMLHLESSEDSRLNSAEGKGKHTSDIDEASIGKIAPTTVSPQELTPVDFYQIHPGTNFNCVIQEGNSTTFGSLADTSDGHAVKVSIYAGESARSCIDLQFLYPGSDGIEVAGMKWNLGEKAGHRLVLQDFDYVLVKDAPQDTAVNHQDVIQACVSEAFPRLVCMTLVLTGRGQGYRRKDIGAATDLFEACLNTILNPHGQYTLRIWFLLPLQPSGTDRQRLSVTRDPLGQKKEHSSSVTDSNGEYLTDPLEASSNTTEVAQPLNMGIAGMSILEQGTKEAKLTFAADTQADTELSPQIPDTEEGEAVARTWEGREVDDEEIDRDSSEDRLIYWEDQYEEEDLSAGRHVSASGAVFSRMLTGRIPCDMPTPEYYSRRDQESE